MSTILGRESTQIPRRKIDSFINTEVEVLFMNGVSSHKLFCILLEISALGTLLKVAKGRDLRVLHGMEYKKGDIIFANSVIFIYRKND